MGKTAVHGAGNCGQKGILNDCNPASLIQYVRKNKRETVPKVMENVDTGCHQTISKSSWITT